MVYDKWYTTYFFVKPALIGWSNRKKVSRGSPVEKRQGFGDCFGKHVSSVCFELRLST